MSRILFDIIITWFDELFWTSDNILHQIEHAVNWWWIENGIKARVEPKMSDSTSWEEMFRLRVVPGKDCEWKGTAIREGKTKFWWKVKWNKKPIGFSIIEYRMGYDGKYDLKIVDAVKSPPQKTLVSKLIQLIKYILLFRTIGSLSNSTCLTSKLNYYHQFVGS